MSRTVLPWVMVAFLGLQVSAISAETDIEDTLEHPPGRLIDVGGFHLHILCHGNTGPVVLLDAGVGGFSLEWTRIQQALADEAVICAYDRAGYGWSDMGPLPRTTNLISEELHTLLANADLPAPDIMVGHSFGGYVVQHYARRWGPEVAGLVLVDASHPEQSQRLPEDKRRSVATIPGGRNVYISNQTRLHPNYPVAQVTRAQHLMLSWKSSLTAREELLNMPLSARQLRNAGALPAVPLVVLSRGRRVWPHDDFGDAMERVWMKLQDELTAQNPDAIHLIAEHAGHSIHLDQPEIVITALRVLIQAGVGEQRGGPLISARQGISVSGSSTP